MVAPTQFVRIACDKLGFIGVFEKLVCIYEELPHHLRRSSLLGRSLRQMYFNLQPYSLKDQILQGVIKFLRNFTATYEGLSYRASFRRGRWHFRKKMTEGVPLFNANYLTDKSKFEIPRLSSSRELCPRFFASCTALRSRMTPKGVGHNDRRILRGYQTNESCFLTQTIVRPYNDVQIVTIQFKPSPR